MWTIWHASQFWTSHHSDFTIGLLITQVRRNRHFFPSFVSFPVVKINWFPVLISLSFLSSISNWKRELDWWDTQVKQSFIFCPMTDCAEYSPQPVELPCGQKQALEVKCFYCKERRQQGSKCVILVIKNTTQSVVQCLRFHYLRGRQAIDHWRNCMRICVQHWSK